MRFRFATPLLLAGAAGAALALAGCGSSNNATGTVAQPITIGTGTDAFDPTGGSGTAATSAPASSAAGSDTAASSGGGAAAGDPAAGKTVFSANCSACHTLKDAGASGAVGPNLDDLKPDAATVQAKVEAGGGGMPPFKGTLSDADIANVAAYVSSVAGK